MAEKKRYNRYKTNLFTEGWDIFSYKTKVATYDPKKGKIVKGGWWSVTTSKHINYIAGLWGFDVEK